MSSLTFIYSYYDNPLMLAAQYQLWASYPEELKQRISIILVDDASPKSPALEVPRPQNLPTLTIYRVKVDIPWHQDGARNLGAHEAEDGWLFCSDIDHAMPAKSLDNLLQTISKHTSNKVFFIFPRLDAMGLKPNEKGPGANIFALTKKMYWGKMFGYDEDMCGQYGSDGAPRRRLLMRAHQVVLNNCPVIRYDRNVIPDASTTAWERRGPENKRRKKEAIERKKKLGRMGKITHLDFEWNRVL